MFTKSSSRCLARLLAGATFALILIVVVLHLVPAMLGARPDAGAAAGTAVAVDRAANASSPASTPASVANQVAPSNEKLDLILKLPERDFEWSSGFESAVHIDEAKKVWQCEMRIPMAKLAASKPSPGTHWRINFYRCDRDNRAFLAWNPTLTGSFHAPERFGILEFHGR